MTDDDLFNEKVMRACSRAAGKVQRVNRRYCEYNDVLSEMYVWLMKNRKYVADWMEQGQHGMNKLHVALYRAGHAYVAKERARKTGAKVGDFYWYTPAVIVELLPDVWEYEAWSQAAMQEPDMPRGKSRPGEGGNRQAMLIDVHYAVHTLPGEDQILLRNMFADGGVDKEALAAVYDISVSGLEKKVARIVDKMVERLGGEPPFWNGGRRARSNASAQSELRARGES